MHGTFSGKAVQVVIEEGVGLRRGRAFTVEWVHLWRALNTWLIFQVFFLL